MTSWSSLRADLTSAGADWVDERVVVCDKAPGPLVGSRKQHDLEVLNQALLRVL